MNQTVEMCFWCGNKKNEEQEGIAVVKDYQPCEACAKFFSKGIHVIGVSDNPINDNQFPILNTNNHNLYPTGDSFVAPVNWVKEMLEANEHPEMFEKAQNTGTLLMPNEIVAEILNDLDKEGQGQSDENNNN